MKKFKRRVLDRFQERMAARFPKFIRTRYTDCPPIESYVYRGDGLSLHLMPKVGRYLTFGLEVGWMRTDRSPIWARIATPDDSANEEGLRCGISQLWSPDDTGWAFILDEEDLGWDDGRIKLSTAEISRRVAQNPDIYAAAGTADEYQIFVLVEDLLDKVATYALPYFGSILGIKWDEVGEPR